MPEPGKPTTAKSSVLLAIGTPILIGLLLFLFATQRGIGVSTDGFKYAWAALNIDQGRGYTMGPSYSGDFEELTHYPPLYSVSLALSGLFQANILIFARWLHALVFAADIFVFGLLLIKVSGGRLWLVVLGSLWLLLTDFMFSFQVTVSSEALYYLFAFGSLLLLTHYVEAASPNYLIGSAVMAAGAALSRYIGVTSGLVGILAILTLKRGMFREKLFKACIYAVISFVLLAIWLIGNQLGTGDATNRTLSFVPVSAQEIRGLFATVATWVLPVEGIINALPAVLLYGIVLIGTACIALIYWRSGRKANAEGQSSRTPLPTIGIIFAVVYFVFLLFSRLFFDSDIPLRYRLLSPIYIVFVVLVIYALSLLSSRTFSPVFLALTALVIMIVVVNGVGFFRQLQEQVKDGVDHNSVAWQQSFAVQQVMALPADVPVFSNEYRLLRISTDHQTYALSDLTAATSPAHFIIAYFKDSENNIPTQDDVEKLFSLKVLFTSPFETDYEYRHS